MVTWEDAVHDNEFQGTADEAGATELCIAIGFLVKKTKKMTVLAGEMDTDAANVRFLMTIPSSLIRDIIYLKPYSDKS